jgi:hypothetical protein
MIARVCLVITFLLIPHSLASAQNPLLAAKKSLAVVEVAKPSPANVTTSMMDTLSKDSEALSKTASSVLSTTISSLSLLILLLIFSKLIIHKLRPKSEIAIENFAVGSGKEELNNVLPGLTQMAREELIREIINVRQKVNKNLGSFGPKGYRMSRTSPLLQKASENRLPSLLTSIKEFIPGQLNPIVQIINVFNILFPSSGTKVTCILQSKGNFPEILGITIEITDSTGEFPPRIYTIWESLSRKSLNLQFDLLEKDRYIALLKPAACSLALELSRREMRKSLNRVIDRSELHIFFGMINSEYAKIYGDFFYQLAIEDLERAIEIKSDLYQPYEYLADIYNIQWQKKQEKDLLDKALANYQIAYQLIVHNENDRKSFQGWLSNPLESLTEIIFRYASLLYLKQFSSREMKKIYSRAKTLSRHGNVLSKYRSRTSKQLANDKKRVRVAETLVRLNLAEENSDEGKKLFQGIEDIWQVYEQDNSTDLSEMDSICLYNLSVLFLTYQRRNSGDQTDSETMFKQACRYLLYSCEKSPEYWNWAMEDQDLKELHDLIPELKDSLLTKKKECERILKSQKIEKSAMRGIIDEIIDNLKQKPLYFTKDLIV